MRFALTLALTAAGFVEPAAPGQVMAASNPPALQATTPDPWTGVLSVMVFPGESDFCLAGATVEVILDGRVIQNGTQITQCDYWDDGDVGVLFTNLPVVPLTLRASAPGYVTGEITATPTVGWSTVTPISLQLCTPSFSQSTLFLGPGAIETTPVTLTSNCSWSALSPSGWLSTPVAQGQPGVTNFPLAVRSPNLTGTRRTAIVTVGTALLTVYQSPASRAADFNADGSMDLLWYNVADGRVSTWLMRGRQLIDGTLLNPAQVPDVNWTPAAVGDVNRDGMADIVWQHTDGRLAVWTMAGTSMIDFRPFSDPVADTAWKIRGFADFNQDGDADVIWQHEGDGRIAVWFMSYGPDSPVRLYGQPLGPGQVIDVNWKIVGTGDFNRDGWPDLVWQHQADGRIAVWKMHGTTLVSGDLLSPGQVADTDWKVRAVSDINGDDLPDLIWQHAATGEVAAWLMNGTTMMSGIHIGLVPDTNWRIVGPR